MDTTKTPNVHHTPSPKPTSGWTPPWADETSFSHQEDRTDLTPPAQLLPSDAWADETTEPKIRKPETNDDSPSAQDRQLPELDPSQPPRAALSRGSLVAGWMAQRLVGAAPIRPLALGLILLSLLALAQALQEGQSQPVAWWILELLEVAHASTC